MAGDTPESITLRSHEKLDYLSTIRKFVEISPFDIHILVDGENAPILAHRTILGAVSPFTQSLFGSVPEDSTFTINLQNTNAIILKKVLYYIYFGGVDLSLKEGIEFCEVLKLLGVNNKPNFPIKNRRLNNDEEEIFTESNPSISDNIAKEIQRKST